MAHWLLKILLKLQSFLALPIWAVGAFWPMKKGTASGYIFGQYSLKGMRFFLAPAENTSCEAVAVYNAAASRPDGGKAYIQVKRLFLSCGALTLWPFGFFGGNPYSLGRVMRKLGIAAKRVEADKAVIKGNYIFSFFNGKSPSLHTVFVVNDGKTIVAYNLYGKDIAPRRFNPEKYRREIITVYRIQ